MYIEDLPITSLAKEFILSLMPLRHDKNHPYGVITVNNSSNDITPLSIDLQRPLTPAKMYLPTHFHLRKWSEL